jgi:membrane protein implicated in regulation of membrane protease activity
MSSSLGRFRRPPNPVTQAAFRRQVRLEIYLPIALTVLAILLLMAVVILVSFGTASSWADVALVLLAGPLAILLVVLTAVLGGAIYLMLLLIREVPTVTSTLQEEAGRLEGAVRRGSDAAVQSILAPAGVAAALGELGRSLRSIFRSE